MTLNTMKHIICTAIAISFLWLSQNGVHCGRQAFQAKNGKTESQRLSSPPASPLNLARSDDSLLDQLLAAANENRDEYMELKNYHRRQPNYLMKWPGLRDLLLTAVDFDNNMDSNDLNDESKGYEIANLRLMERLRQLAERSESLPSTDELENIGENTADQGQRQREMMLKNYENPRANEMNFKNHGTKKNVQFRKQFMAPCHFKVCYMGPKRNIRYASTS